MKQAKQKQPDATAAKDLQAHKTPLKPEHYSSILKEVQLEDLYLSECSARVQKEKLSVGPLHVSLSDEKTAKPASKSKVIVDHHYELTAGTAGPKKNDWLLKLSCTFRLIYSSGDELTEDFIDVFLQHNVPLNTWPYFREFVQSVTQRMNIPPLVLPLLK